MKSTFQATLLMFAGVAMATATPEQTQEAKKADENCRWNECMRITNTFAMCTGKKRNIEEFFDSFNICWDQSNEDLFCRQRSCMDLT